MVMNYECNWLGSRRVCVLAQNVSTKNLTRLLLRQERIFTVNKLCLNQGGFRMVLMWCSQTEPKFSFLVFRYRKEF